MDRVRELSGCLRFATKGSEKPGRKGLDGGWSGGGIPAVAFNRHGGASGEVE